MDSKENYYFLRMYSIDLDMTLQAIKVLRRYKCPDVQHALLRDVTVSYVRPFSTNKGEHGKHELSAKKHVSKHLRPLHAELVRVRMQQFAHTDLTYYTPQALKLTIGQSAGYAMMFKHYNYAGLLDQLPQIEELVRAVERSVNSEITEYEIDQLL